MVLLVNLSNSRNLFFYANSHNNQGAAYHTLIVKSNGNVIYQKTSEKLQDAEFFDSLTVSPNSNITMSLSNSGSLNDNNVYAYWVFVE